MNTVLILSCEHAVDTVPKTYKELFAPYAHLLTTHRAIDFGTSEIAHYLASLLHCELIEATATRLLVDCNRSLNNRACFSEITRPLAKEEKEKIIAQYYLPYRQAIEDFMSTKYKQGNKIWHFSIHSFTPEFDELTRNADIGILYDPKRPQEKLLAGKLRHIIKELAPEYRVRKNYPYRGSNDGFTTVLRKYYAAEDYVGIELECNQSLVFNRKHLNRLKNILGKSLMQLYKGELSLISKYHLSSSRMRIS